MWIYIALMLSSDGQGHLYGAYASPNQACVAAQNCQRFERIWQDTAWHQAREQHTVELRTHFTQLRPTATFETAGPLNLCVVQRAYIGEDDKVEDVWCPQSGVEVLDHAK